MELISRLAAQPANTLVPSPQGDQTQIRAVKMYYMRDTEKKKKDLKRVKGTAEQNHKHLGPEDFGQEMDRAIYANRYRLGPTPGHEILIAFESRKIISAANSKRRCEVRLGEHTPFLLWI